MEAYITIIYKYFLLPDVHLSKLILAVILAEPKDYKKLQIN